MVEPRPTAIAASAYSPESHDPKYEVVHSLPSVPTYVVV